MKNNSTRSIQDVFDEFITLCESYNSAETIADKTKFYGMIVGFTYGVAHMNIELNSYIENVNVIKAYCEYHGNLYEHNFMTAV